MSFNNYNSETESKNEENLQIEETALMSPTDSAGTPAESRQFLSPNNSLMLPEFQEEQPEVTTPSILSPEAMSFHRLNLHTSESNSNSTRRATEELISFLSPLSSVSEFTKTPKREKQQNNEEEEEGIYFSPESPSRPSKRRKLHSPKSESESEKRQKIHRRVMQTQNEDDDDPEQKYDNSMHEDELKKSFLFIKLECTEESHGGILKNALIKKNPLEIYFVSGMGFFFSFPTKEDAEDALKFSENSMDFKVNLVFLTWVFDEETPKVIAWTYFDDEEKLHVLPQDSFHILETTRVNDISNLKIESGEVRPVKKVSEDKAESWDQCQPIKFSRIVIEKIDIEKNKNNNSNSSLRRTSSDLR